MFGGNQKCNRHVEAGAAPTMLTQKWFASSKNGWGGQEMVGTKDTLDTT